MSAGIDSEQAEHTPDAAHHQLHNTDLVTNLSDNGGAFPQLEFAEEEVRPVMEAIASTGAFWIEWDKLKNLLSFKLKQVLSEYPEGKMTVEQQNACLGEPYQELVQRLDEALLSFDEGPPFTLQRLCEIMLCPQSVYPKLSKLALALEKNLLVSSMLIRCTDAHSQRMVQGGDGSERTEEKPELQAPSEENEGDVVMADGYERVTDVKDDDEVGIPIAVETTEKTVAPSEANPSEGAAAPTAEPGSASNS